MFLHGGIFLQLCNIFKKLTTNQKQYRFMKRFSLFLFSILLFLFAHSQQDTKGSLLFEVSGNGLTKSSYIFGTFHIMCKDQFSISPTLAAKIVSTEQFYGELDMDDPTMQSSLMQKIMMKDKTIESLMDSVSFKRFDEAFKKITGFSAYQLNNYKPFFHLSLLTLKTIPCINFVQPETELMQIAKKNGKEVLGLETVEEQMNAIDAQPLDSQISSLQKMVLNFDSTKNMMNEMITVYLKNDAELLYEFVQKQGTDGINEEVLLVNRNKNWIQKLKKIMQEKSSFIAVGGAHLGGKTGVLALLRDAGYIVKPVKY
jgi:uncharacterized protein YbaP (TraB family)